MRSDPEIPHLDDSVTGAAEAAKLRAAVVYYRRQARRALLLASGVLLLAIGALIGWGAGRWGVRIGAHGVRAGEPPGGVEASSAFVEIARAVEPSVVSIFTVTRPTTRERAIPGTLEGMSRSGDEPAKRGSGSGVIVDTRGYILTNNHVIEGVDRIRVVLANRTELPATLVGSDRETDLAVIRIEPTDSMLPLKAARIGDSEKMRVGDWVLAIGSPFGFDQTVTAGIISARERDSSDIYKRVGFQYFLQTDAAINRGNSGGPLINLSGEVVGINTAIATSTGDYNGICFALPSSEAMSIYRQLMRDGRVVRGFLGALTERVTPQIARIYKLPVVTGAIVSNVSESMEVDGRMVESPAARAGLKPHDIIIEFNGERIRDDSDLVRRVASTTVGTKAGIRLFRDGEEKRLEVVIGQRPGSLPERTTGIIARGDEAAGAKTRTQTLGIRIESITAQVAREKQLGNLRACLVLRIDPGSIADDAELRANDVIESINREPIRDNDDFKRVLAGLKAGDPVVLQVYRESLQPVPRIFISLNRP